MTTDLHPLIDDLTGCVGPDQVTTDLERRRVASKDYAWLSPILTEELPDAPADAVVRPARTGDVPAVLDVASRHGVPVTPRGRGTGNYGQAVPLERGVVLDLSGCDALRQAAGGVADVEAGATFAAVERQLAADGWELPVLPSMVNSTIGGFLSGGNQGIGSIENGSIWDGWVLGLDVVGCLPGATAFGVEGPGVQPHLHAYGTAGILTAARVRLVPARRRLVLFAVFERFEAAATAGRELMDLDPPPRAVSVADGALVDTLPPHPGLRSGEPLLRAALEVGTVGAAEGTVARHGGRVTALDEGAVSALYASVYNHATLRAKRVDPTVCSLQVRGWELIERGDEVRAALPEARLHLDGNAPAAHGPGYSGLLLSRWEGRAVLQAGMERLRDLGVRVISPHTWVLGGHGNLERIRAVRDLVDPSGLLNPGKLPPA